MRRIVSRAVLMSGVLASPGARGQEPPAPSTPAMPRLTAQEDHERMLKVLGIESLRPGVHPSATHPTSPANYDEAKVRAYKLPDPLMCKDGTRVETPAAWWGKRRPEIVEDFDREVLGRVPRDVPAVRWEVVATKTEPVDGIPAVVKRVVGHVDNARWPAIAVEIPLTLTTPAAAAGPVPVILGLDFPPGFFGPRPGGTGAENPADRGAVGPTWRRQVLARGWGYATLVPASFQEDNGAGLSRGIIGLCNRGQPRRPDDWGTLRAWAWGASRALDYFEADPAVDARQVVIEGLSRYGKAALVAFAYDPRFAVGFIGSSGEGGAKLHRRNFGEQVENLTGPGLYHWMAGNFMKYGGPLTADDLPVDAHELIALCAPRPTFISYGATTGPGAEGPWFDQRGSFLAAVAAGPVFALLGKRDLGTAEFPAVDVGKTDGDLAFRQHAGGHTSGPNWPSFLDFAARYLKPGAAAPGDPQPRR